MLYSSRLCASDIIYVMLLRSAVGFYFDDRTVTCRLFIFSFHVKCKVAFVCRLVEEFLLCPREGGGSFLTDKLFIVILISSYCNMQLAISF